MKLPAAIALSTALLCASSVFAAVSEAPGAMEADKLFSQVVVHPVPDHFRIARVENVDGRYLEQSVREGETADKWTQMITVSGAQGLAENHWSTPKRFAAALVQRYTDRCAGVLRVRDRGDLTISDHDAHALLLGCELASKTGDPYSEATLFLIIKGDKDFYTVQWSERNEATPYAMGLDLPKWTERQAALMPTKLCPMVTGDSDASVGCGAQK
jgi:hypothetical protein